MKKYLRSDIILMFLVCISLTVIIVFVDFTNDTKIKNYNVDVYKIYYLYDDRSEPISLSYEMINIEKNTDQKEIIEKVFNKQMKLSNKEILIIDLKIDKNQIELTIDNDINKLSSQNIECLVNSVLEINNYKVLIINYQNQKKEYYSTINDYYINSPLVNKLSTYIYRDSNYGIIYQNEKQEEVKLTIQNSKENQATYFFDDQTYKVEKRKDGLYLNGEKVLSSTYKVDEKWDNSIITKVTLSDEKTRIIEIKKENEDGTTTMYCLKQGIGMYKYQLIDSKGKIIKSYIYKSKVFNEVQDD